MPKPDAGSKHRRNEVGLPSRVARAPDDCRRRDPSGATPCRRGRHGHQVRPPRAHTSMQLGCRSVRDGGIQPITRSAARLRSMAMLMRTLATCGDEPRPRLPGHRRPRTRDGTCSRGARARQRRCGSCGVGRGGDRQVSTGSGGDAARRARDITVRRGACYLADSLLPFGLFIALSSSPAGDLQSLVNVLGCRRRRRRRWGGRGGATTPGLRRHR
jgi:hypothetical protein